jgi:hypothetical protein
VVGKLAQLWSVNWHSSGDKTAGYRRRQNVQKEQKIIQKHGIHKIENKHTKQKTKTIFKKLKPY